MDKVTHLINNYYICTIVDKDGFVVEEFKHRQYTLSDAEKFETMILEAIRTRDSEPRFIMSRSFY